MGTLSEQVVIIASLTIHADPDSVLLQETGEGLPGELGTMVGVEDIRFALLERLLKCFDTETGRVYISPVSFNNSIKVLLTFLPSFSFTPTKKIFRRLV